MTKTMLTKIAAAATAVLITTGAASAQFAAAYVPPPPPPNDPGNNERIPRDAERPEPTAPKVCFYSEVEFKGQHFCVTESTRTPFVEDVWKDRIASIKVFDHANVKVCSEPSLRGSCLYVGFYKKSLPNVLDNHVYSFKIQ